MRSTLLLLALGCRDYHEQPPFEVCQPYPLDCPGCTFDADLADDEGLLRAWRCEDAAGGARLDAVTREAVDLDAVDTHFYDPATGARRAALREHARPIEVCGRELAEEWWGEVLDCAAVCEHDPALPEADPGLPACD